MAAADVDVGYIAGHLGLDEPVVQSLATEPTLDLVTALLQAVATKAHEFDELYAAKLQIDIELENAVRGAESRSQASRESTEKALKDLEEARQKLKEEGKLPPPRSPSHTVDRRSFLTDPIFASRNNPTFSRERVAIPQDQGNRARSGAQGAKRQD
jgi:nucleoprotein TPR